MKLLDMKLVGRNFYDPTSAMVLQQHRSVVVFSSLLNVLERNFSLWLPYVVQKSQQYFTIVNTVYRLNPFHSLFFSKFTMMLIYFVSWCFLTVTGEGGGICSTVSNGGVDVSVFFLELWGKAHLCLQVADLARLCS